MLKSGMHKLNLSYDKRAIDPNGILFYNTAAKGVTSDFAGFTIHESSLSC